jgi:hypothetical protein
VRRRSRIGRRRGSRVCSGVGFSTFSTAYRPRSSMVEMWFSNHGFSCIRCQRRGDSSTPAERAKVFGRLGWRLQAPSKSVCSILPVAPRLSGQGCYALAFLLAPIHERQGSGILRTSC